MISFSFPTIPSLLSLLIPITYLSILIGSMATFSYLYRRRQFLQKMRLAPYFPPHTTRNAYLSLLHLPDTSSHGEKPTKVPDSVLRAALLSRAVTDVQRIIQIRARKPALSTLLQRGVVGDEIWQRLLRAEQELEAEVKDVVAEANALAPGWGQTIFQSASEMAQNHILRDKLANHREGIEDERQRWEETKEMARKELMGETTTGQQDDKAAGKKKVAASAGGGGAAGGSAAGGSAAGVSTPPLQLQEAQDKVAAPKTGSSDEDGVLVEPPPAAADGANVESPASTPGGGGSSGGGGGKKKKKGKK